MASRLREETIQWMSPRCANSGILVRVGMRRSTRQMQNKEKNTVKRNLMKWKKILASYLAGKRLISRMCQYPKTQQQWLVLWCKMMGHCLQHPLSPVNTSLSLGDSTSIQLPAYMSGLGEGSRRSVLAWKTQRIPKFSLDHCSHFCHLAGWASGWKVAHIPSLSLFSFPFQIKQNKSW